MNLPKDINIEDYLGCLRRPRLLDRGRGFSVGMHGYRRADSQGKELHFNFDRPYLPHGEPPRPKPPRKPKAKTKAAVAPKPAEPKPPAPPSDFPARPFSTRLEKISKAIPLARVRRIYGALPARGYTCWMPNVWRKQMRKGALVLRFMVYRNDFSQVYIFSSFIPGAIVIQAPETSGLGPCGVWI